MTYLTKGLAGLFGAAIAAASVAGAAADPNSERPAFTLQAPGTGIDAPAKKQKPVTSNCKPTKKISKISENTTTAKANTTNPVPLADTKVAFKMKAKGCVMVRFSAHLTYRNGQAVAARAVLDGQDVLQPAAVLLAGNDLAGDKVFVGSHSFEFVLDDVAKGKHTVQIEWAQIVGGNPRAQIGPRTTVVEY